MKFVKVGQEIEIPKATLPPIALAESNVFEILTLLLGKIKKEKSNSYQLFVENVTDKLLSNTKNIGFKREDGKLTQTLEKYKHLLENYNLVRLHLNYLIDGLGLTEEVFWENQKTSFPIESFIPSILIQFYYHLISLIELLGRDPALKFYQEFVDKYNETVNARNQANIHKSLDEMREEHLEWMKTNPYGRIRVFGEVKDGQLIRICNNCEKYFSLRNHEMANDKEIFYTLLCFMHIPLARVWNPNFVLTIEKSLARGDPYCAYIYNDMRKRKDAQPPTKEYLDEVWGKNM
ncbi:MAG: hypothetical protein GNW80_11850 [Asgard group archaeon]|nr:hypothetical protein [Asgard group archaeon]